MQNEKRSPAAPFPPGQPAHGVCAGRPPLEFVVGAGRVIRGFDQAVTGLTVGGTRSPAWRWA